MSDTEKPSGSAAFAEAVDAARSVRVQPATMPHSPPDSMPKTASHEFLEFEGTTVFAPAPAPTYRYTLTLKCGKLRIWLEDSESKKQWCSTELSLDDYVDASNVILDATASDYVECFRDLFDSASSTNFPCTFQHYKDGVFQLQSAVQVQVLQKTRKATYSFQLLPISVERIDVLESKLRDLQDEVDALRKNDQSTTARQDSAIQKLEESTHKLQKGLISHDTVIPQLKQETKALHAALEESVVISVQATNKVQGDLICWNNSAFLFSFRSSNVTGLDGIVRVQTPGMYQVNVVVNHQATAHNMTIEVLKGSESIQTAFAGFDQGLYSSTSLACTARLDKADQLKVKCSAQLVQTSYLTLVRLGK